MDFCYLQDQAVISEVVNSVVDSACTDCKDRDSDEEHFADRFKISDPTNFRCVSLILDDEELSDGSTSSDEDFDRFFETISQVRPENRAFKSEENIVACKANSSIIEHEYDNLPAIEELSIHVLEDIPLVQFGKVVSIVDRQDCKICKKNRWTAISVVIEADSNIALDFETIVFDAERNSVGEVQFFTTYIRCAWAGRKATVRYSF
ncbi:unnamed protein product [Gongylonema pulchrum]|uniref:Helicase n=1 Tax=Gongylonema pulchrum TaxID=637853 RepID=A0A183EP75_9BILA|nr:unnamed protein product [Gongylonema pulchrum]